MPKSKIFSIACWQIDFKKGGKSMIKKLHLFTGLLVMAIGVTIALAMGATLAAVSPTATPVPPKPTPVPPTLAPVPSTPAPTPATVLTIGLKPGERFHDIHTSRLQIKCDFCHVKQVETYYDPLAQVFNLADRRACLSCHKEGGVQPFYGEKWSEAKTGR